MFSYNFWHFILLFNIKFVFLSFSFIIFFDEVSQQNLIQSEIGIGGQKLSV